MRPSNKADQFKIELKALMDKYGYKFMEPSDPYYPPTIVVNDDESDPMDILSVLVFDGDDD